MGNNNDPLAQCFSRVSYEVEKYVKKNKKLEDSNPGCWDAFKKRFKDANLTARKVRLAQDVLYTIGKIQDDVNKRTLANEQCPASQCAELDYHAEITAFARLKHCLDTAKTTVREYNEIRLAGEGDLLAALNQATETYDDNWLEYKENRIWNNEKLWGVVFQHSDSMKTSVFASFDAELPLRAARFTAIMSDQAQSALVSVVSSSASSSSNSKYQDPSFQEIPLDDISKRKMSNV